jgi:uncharacterized membrane protein YidH (DUF202 family)
MTNERKKFPWIAFALALLAFAFSVPALLVTLYTIARFRMPYNEEGNHFDGIVVHHAGSEYVYLLLSAVLWAIVIAAGVFARRQHRRARIH